ncbi:hypothetical protein [Mycoplasma wenyonii]|nr:hypothetical protein [Mycoplasma wenyonii]
MGLVPVAGIVIAYPLISIYKNKEGVGLKSLEDFKRNCLVLVKERDDKQLLTCPVTSNSSDTSFYFYKKGDNEQLPQKIKEIKVNEGRLELITLNDQKIEIKSSKLNFLTNKDLLKECKVNWQKKESKEKILTCSNQTHSPKLENLNK